MRKSTKILLSIPSLIVLSYTLTLWFPTEFLWLAPTMKEYYFSSFHYSRFDNNSIGVFDKNTLVF